MRTAFKIKSIFKAIIHRFIDSYFLYRYQNADFIVKQKVRVLSVILITAAFLITCLFSYHLFLSRPVGVLVMRSIALISCLLVLGMIRKGHFSMAGIVMLSALFFSEWSAMFLDKSSLISASDTIALVICTFSSCALVLDKKKWMIFTFWAINIALLAFFSYHITQFFGLTLLSALEYFLDNFIALFFVATISYQVISINNNALNKANESIQTTEREAQKNKNLSESLELKVNQRTKELLDNNMELQKEIMEREIAESRLQETQQQLIESAHKAGMAEIASDTLHNVGNVLNSIKTSAYLIDQSTRKRPNEGFTKACNLIRENQHRIDSFLTEDPNGKKLIDYFLQLDGEFQSTFEQISSDSKRLKAKIETVAEVVVAQQKYAGTASLTVSADIKHIVDDALAMIPDLITNLNIEIKKDFQPVPSIQIQKNKLLHTLVNLFKNAAQAMIESNPQNRLLGIKIFQEESHVILEISDSGCGISEDLLGKIFSHGFTTKNDGLGFGLHSCANYLDEMGATIEAQSQGINQGATFIIRFPILPFDHINY